MKKCERTLNALEGIVVGSEMAHGIHTLDWIIGFAEEAAECGMRGSLELLFNASKKALDYPAISAGVLIAAIDR